MLAVSSSEYRSGPDLNVIIRCSGFEGLDLLKLRQGFRGCRFPAVVRHRDDSGSKYVSKAFETVWAVMLITCYRAFRHNC